MNIINETCQAKGEVKYFGSKKQCTEKPVKTLIFATDKHSFTKKELMNELSEWKKRVKAEKLYPMPRIEGIEDASTEAKYKEGRYKTVKLKDAVEGAKYRFDVSICGYIAISTLENSEFTRVYEVLDDGRITCDVQKDGTIKGRKLSSLNIEGRKRATDEDEAHTNVVLKFSSPAFSVIDVNVDDEDIEGIYHIGFDILSETATKVEFKAFAGCSRTNITTLEQNDIKYLKNTDKSKQTITSLAYDENKEVYTIKGTGLEKGFIRTNGVIEKGDILYKG